MSTFHPYGPYTIAAYPVTMADGTRSGAISITDPSARQDGRIFGWIRYGHNGRIAWDNHPHRAMERAVTRWLARD